MKMKLKDTKALQKEISEKGKNFQKALVYSLEVLLEKLINHAKQSGEYVDRTGNLKSGIGGVVLLNKKPITYKGFEQVLEGAEGIQRSESFLESLIPNMPNGYVILIVAGMDYASYVQEGHGLNVLQSSSLRLDVELPKVLSQLKKSLK
jgi:hypothetical protein